MLVTFAFLMIFSFLSKKYNQLYTIIKKVILLIIHINVTTDYNVSNMHNVYIEYLSKNVKVDRLNCENHMRPERQFIQNTFTKNKYKKKTVQSFGPSFRHSKN